MVLGQHVFNDTGTNTRTFGVEEYVFPERYNQFDPTQHDIGEYENGRHTRTHTRTLVRIPTL